MAGSTVQNINGLAAEFTKAWKGELGKVGEMYDDAYASVGRIDELAAQFGSEFDRFRDTYTPYRDMLLEMSGADNERRKELAETFMSLARPDYEGEGNRAMADVAHQSALARGQMTRELTRGGGSPSGSNYRSMVRQNALDEAKNKVLAGTVARNAEKSRVAGMVLPGIQVFDPTSSLNAAAGIDANATKLLEGELGATTTATGMRTNIAGGRARDVAAPLEGAAGTYQGMAWTEKLAGEQNKPAPIPNTNQGKRLFGTYGMPSGLSTSLAGALR